jgi:hypothetical protein
MHLRAASKGVGYMTKLLLAFATALLISGTLGAATLGVHFDAPSRMACCPAPVSFSDVFRHSSDLIGTQEGSWGAIESL